MKFRNVFCGALALLAGGGCAISNRFEREANLDDGYESVDAADMDKHGEFRDFSSGPSLILDASKRVVTTSSYNKRTWAENRVQPERIICAEPSPDVAQGVSRAIEAAISAAAKGKAGVEGSGSASFGFTSSVAIAQLGERLATIQLLRDELSDLCRSYANGAISTTNYTLRLSSLDDKMVTLLMGEMAAGAFGRTLASVDGAAGAGVAHKDAAREKELQAQVIAAGGTVAEKKKFLEQSQDLDLKAASGDSAKVVKSDATRKAEQELANAEAQEAAIKAELDLARALVSQTYSLARSQQAGRLPPGVFEAPSNSVVSLQENFLNKIRIGTIIEACITALDRADTKGNKIAEGNLEAKAALGELEKLEKDLAKVSAELATNPEIQSNREINRTDPGPNPTPSTELRTLLRSYEELKNKVDVQQRVVDRFRGDNGQSPLTNFARMCGGDERQPYNYQWTNNIAYLDDLAKFGLLPEITRQLLVQQKQREEAEARARDKQLDACLLLIGSPEKHLTDEAKNAMKACYSKLAAIANVSSRSAN